MKRRRERPELGGVSDDQRGTDDAAPILLSSGSLFTKYCFKPKQCCLCFEKRGNDRLSANPEQVSFSFAIESFEERHTTNTQHMFRNHRPLQVSVIKVDQHDSPFMTPVAAHIS